MKVLIEWLLVNTRQDYYSQRVIENVVQETAQHFENVGFRVFPGRIRAVYSTPKQDIDLCDGYLYRNKFNFVLLVEGQCANYTEPRRISDKYHGCTLVFRQCQHFLFHQCYSRYQPGYCYYIKKLEPITPFDVHVQSSRWQYHMQKSKMF